MGKIGSLDQMEEKDGLSEDMWEERRNLKGDMEEISLQEEILWKQKAKFICAKEGDINNSFFYKIANVR